MWLVWCNISKKKIDQVILLVNEGFSLNETNQCSENHKIITNPFSDEKSNEISNQFSKNNHKIITNLSSDEQSNEISNQSSKNNHKIITNQSSDKNSKISNHSIENAHKNLDEPNKAPEMSSSHKRLIEEMLQGSSNHSLVIGHTRQTVRSHLHALSLNDYIMFAHELPGLRDRFVKMEVIPPSSYTTSLVHELVMSSRHTEAQDMTPSKETSLPSNVTNSTHSPSQTIKSAFPIGTQPVRSANTDSLSATSQNTKSQSQNIESASQNTKSQSQDIDAASQNTKSQSQNIESASQNTKSQSQNIQLASQNIKSKSQNIEAASQNTKSKSEIPLNDESKSATSQNAESQSVAPAKRKSCESKSVEDKFPRTMLLLSALQMIEEDYPIPLRGELSAKFSKYINTKEVYAEVTPTSPLYGLDCEMCGKPFHTTS
ncbi:probable serine/threonine-protein kinase DDB_G0282963 [Diaphorina citri]|uniref:Probable serine/threonine-protein kinase DDB_G0282963 n=1 Tax=Diaphorina citri TaxID=121845 RepID=A0A3Q0J420_DIACI|nr:probable serine/threonine-protein kinase DDB_G0282963 [Diaphorina citri]